MQNMRFRSDNDIQNAHPSFKYIFRIWCDKIKSTLVRDLHDPANVLGRLAEIFKDVQNIRTFQQIYASEDHNVTMQQAALLHLINLQMCHLGQLLEQNNRHTSVSKTIYTAALGRRSRLNAAADLTVSYFDYSSYNDARVYVGIFLGVGGAVTLACALLTLWTLIAAIPLILGFLALAGTYFWFQNSTLPRLEAEINQYINQESSSSVVVELPSAVDLLDRLLDDMRARAIAAEQLHSEEGKSTGTCHICSEAFSEVKQQQFLKIKKGETGIDYHGYCSQCMDKHEQTCIRSGRFNDMAAKDSAADASGEGQQRRLVRYIIPESQNLQNLLQMRSILAAAEPLIAQLRVQDAHVAVDGPRPLPAPTSLRTASGPASEEKREYKSTQALSRVNVSWRQPSAESSAEPEEGAPSHTIEMPSLRQPLLPSATPNASWCRSD